MRLRPDRRVLCVAVLGLTTVLQAPGYALIQETNFRWKAENETQKIRVVFSENEVRVLPRTPGSPVWELGLSLRRYGGPECPRSSGSALLLVGEDRVQYLRGALVEWFRNTPDGIEHGLEISEWREPALLRFDFSVSGSLTPKVSEDGQSVAFRNASGAPVLSYLDLRGLDAEGREVDARWERIEHAGDSEPILRLVLLGADHLFPLRVQTRLASPKGASTSAAIARSGTDTAALSPPPNDLCAGAEIIPDAGPFPYLSSIVDLTDATTTGDPPSPSCQTNVSRSVWFAFTPATTAAYTFSVCSDAPTATTVEDTVLALYSATGACSGLAEPAGGCDDDTCGAVALQSVISDQPLAAGTTYYVVVWSYGTTIPPSGGASVQLQVVQRAPPGPVPPNDQCAGAEPIPAAGPFPYLTSITADISGATTIGDPPVPSCQSSASRSIWYSFTPASSGRYTFSVCADEPTGSTVDDTVLAIYTETAACGGFQEVAGGCDDDSCAGEPAQSESTGVSLAAGTRYDIVVWVFGSATPATGNTSIQLRVSQVTSPPNDSCASAAHLSLDTPLSGTTIDASDDTRLPSGSGCFAGIGQVASLATGRDVAYRFTAPVGGRYSFRVSGTDTSRNAVLYVSSDCPAAGAPALVAGCLGAANRTSNSPEQVSYLPLAAGQSIYVYVDEDTSTSGSLHTIEANTCPMERDPNGSPASAEDPACGTEGSVAPAGDADFFTLGIPVSDSRVFAMVDGAAGNSTDFDLRVTTGADTLEYDDFNNDLPFGSASPNVSGARLNGAASYLRVSHYSPAGQAEPYRLYASLQPPASRADPEIEPNNTIASATGGPGGYFSGALSGAGDVDIFSFTAVAGDLVQIGLDLDPLRDSTPFNGSLALLDASGATLLLVNDPTSSSSTSAGAGSLTASTPYAPGEAMIDRIRSTGTYYVKVAWSSGIPGDYLLSVSRNCRIGPATDMAVTQNDSPDPVATAGTVTYSINVRNLGGHPASVLTLRDDLPAGATLVSALPSQGICTGSGPVVCHLGDLDAGASATVSLMVGATVALGSITNTVRVSTAVIDSSPENDLSTETTTVGAVDGDGDGVPDAADCAPTDPSAWTVPGEALGLTFPAPGDTTRLGWSAASTPGGTVLRYDLVRSTTAGNFQSPACVATDTLATSAVDIAVPTAIFYYLVRSENICGGNLGTKSDGTPRTAGPCP